MSIEEPAFMRLGLSKWRPPARDADSLEEKRKKLDVLKRQIRFCQDELTRWEWLFEEYGAKGLAAHGLRCDLDKKRLNVRGLMEWAEQLETQIAQESRRLEVESNAALEYLR